MKKKVLVFEEKDKLAEFIITHRKYGIIVNFDEQTLIGMLTEREIRVASERYGAHLSTSSDFV